MAPITVNIISKETPLSEITVDFTETSKVKELKTRVWAKTSIPVEFMEVLVSGLTQVTVVDRRSMKVGYCGASNATSLIVGGKK